MRYSKEQNGMKPEELDVVRLLRPLPDHNLLAGARGTLDPLIACS
jgi:hypothetical protein